MLPFMKKQNKTSKITLEDIGKKIDLRFDQLQNQIDYLADSKVPWSEHKMLASRVSSVESVLPPKK